MIVIHTKATRQPSNNRIVAGIDPAFFNEIGTTKIRAVDINLPNQSYVKIAASCVYYLFNYVIKKEFYQTLVI